MTYNGTEEVVGVIFGVAGVSLIVGERVGEAEHPVCSSVKKFRMLG